MKKIETKPLQAAAQVVDWQAGTRRTRWTALVLALLASWVFVLSLGVGGEGWSWDADEWVWSIRAPRGAGAWLAGALLGLAGSLAQGLFRNPLAEPYLLGNAAGASLAFACGLVFVGAAPWLGGWVEVLGFTGLSFLGSMVAVLLTVALAQGGASLGQRNQNGYTTQGTAGTGGLRLLLAGVIVGVVLGALGSLLGVRYPEILPVMQSFTLGATGLVNWQGVLIMAAVLVLCLSLALVFSAVLDALNLGEEAAHSLGLPVATLRWLLLAVVALATAGATAQTGLIAFVGLAAPHTVRTLFALQRKGARSGLHSGMRQRHIVLLSTLMGGLLLQVADLAARWLMAPEELPVGVLTAVLGGVYLLWLMQKGRV
jgi:iron complex transport system permease protein